jgi:hypothetical protein
MKNSALLGTVIGLFLLNITSRFWKRYEVTSYTVSIVAPNSNKACKYPTDRFIHYAAYYCVLTKEWWLCTLLHHAGTKQNTQELCYMPTDVGVCIYQRFQTCGAPPPPEGDADPLGGTFFIWRTYLFWTKYGRRINIYFGKHFAWLKYFTYHLVPVLTPNYKQHILSPAKVRKVSTLINSWTSCQTCSFEFIRVKGWEVHETF